MRRTLIVYQAGPLFSEAEQDWHRKLKARIERRFAGLGATVDVRWPGEFFAPEDVEAWGPDAPHHIYRGCVKALADADLLVALLDGTQVDDGTAFEIGYFACLHPDRPILGVRTDFRRGGDTDYSRVNAMIEGACSAIVDSIDAVVDYVERTRTLPEQ